MLSNERNKVVKFSTGKGACPKDQATPRLTTGRQQQVTESHLSGSQRTVTLLSLSLRSYTKNKQTKKAVQYTQL